MAATVAAEIRNPKHRPLAREARNPKHEIRNKFKARNSKHETISGDPVLIISLLDFEFVSDFGFRASDFPRSGP
jgi:hypothetical protein